MRVVTVDISLPTSGLSVASDSGSGRVFLTIVDDVGYTSVAQSLAAQLAQTVRSVLVTSAPVTTETWESLSESLAEILKQLGIRQVSMIGLGGAATLAQNLALAHPKLVRTLAVVDATSRPHPTRWERIVDRVEENLPFGLPLRLGTRSFNIKSYVHRLRCPLLVIGTKRAGMFVRNELESVSRLAPTAWHVMVEHDDADQEIDELTTTLLAFQDVPAKCPQKNTMVAA